MQFSFHTPSFGEAVRTETVLYCTVESGTRQWSEWHVTVASGTCQCLHWYVTVASGTCQCLYWHMTVTVLLIVVSTYLVAVALGVLQLLFTVILEKENRLNSYFLNMCGGLRKPVDVAAAHCWL